jgi:hypothetical protein
MPPTDEHYSHKDIWVAITELTGRIDNGLAIMAERKESVAKITRDVDALFSRQRQLETQMAQVRLVGGLAVLLMPFAITGLVLAIGSHFLQARPAIPVAIERQEKGQ